MESDPAVLKEFITPLINNWPCTSTYEYYSIFHQYLPMCIQFYVCLYLMTVFNQITHIYHHILLQCFMFVCIFHQLSTSLHLHTVSLFYVLLSLFQYDPFHHPYLLELLYICAWNITRIDIDLRQEESIGYWSWLLDI